MQSVLPCPDGSGAARPQRPHLLLGKLQDARFSGEPAQGVGGDTCLTATAASVDVGRGWRGELGGFRGGEDHGYRS